MTRGPSRRQEVKTVAFQFPAEGKILDPAIGGGYFVASISGRKGEAVATATEIREHAEYIGRYAMLLLFEPKKCYRAQCYCAKEQVYARSKKEQSRDKGNEGEERCQASREPQRDWMRARRESEAVAARHSQASIATQFKQQSAAKREAGAINWRGSASRVPTGPNTFRWQRRFRPRVPLGTTAAHSSAVHE